MSALFQTIAGWFSSRMAPAAAAALPVRLGGRGSFSATTTPARVHGFDQPLVWVVVTLLLWGLVMVYSASVALPDSPKFARYSPTYFLTRHALFIFISFVAAVITVVMPAIPVLYLRQLRAALDEAAPAE